MTLEARKTWKKLKNLVRSISWTLSKLFWTLYSLNLDVDQIFFTLSHGFSLIFSPNCFMGLFCSIFICIVSCISLFLLLSLLLLAIVLSVLLTTFCHYFYWPLSYLFFWPHFVITSTGHCLRAVPFKYTMGGGGERHLFQTPHQ